LTSRTTPYFHNGSVDTFKEAVRIISKYQIGDVAAFLKVFEGKNSRKVTLLIIG